MTQTQFKRIPFDLNLAKKIMNGDIIGGRIVTQEGFEASILYVDMNRYGNTYLTVIVDDGEKEFGMFCLSDGKRADGFDDSDKGRFDLYIELPIYHKDYSNFEPCKWQPCVVRESEDYSWLVQICAEKKCNWYNVILHCKRRKMHSGVLSSTKQDYRAIDRHYYEFR